MATRAWQQTVFTAVVALSFGAADTGAATADVVVAPAEAEAPQAARMTLRVRNDARLPDDLVADAKAAVTAIYAKADIEVTFVEARGDLTIVLLSRQTADNMHQIPDAVGFAPGTELGLGRIAYVLQPRVDRIAEGYSTPRAVVLAAAIAHEVGHLLMVDAHSTTGIMRPEWNQADFRRAVHGSLVFSRDQAAHMRVRLDRNGAR